MPDSAGITPEVGELFDDANGDLALGDLDAAVTKYRRCTDLAPDFADGWHALAMALMKLGRNDEAIAAALKNTELRPNDQLAWSSLSICYVKNHQVPEAEAAGAKARILSWGGKIRKGAQAARIVAVDPGDRAWLDIPMSKQRHPVVHVSLDIGMSGCFSPPHLLGPKQLNLGRRHGFDDVKQGSLFLSIADILDVHRPVA